jgi:hypothetical protein
MNEELQNSYFLPKIFTVINSRGMRWVGNLRRTRNA